MNELQVVIIVAPMAEQLLQECHQLGGVVLVRPAKVQVCVCVFVCVCVCVCLCVCISKYLRVTLYLWLSSCCKKAASWEWCLSDLRRWNGVCTYSSNGDVLVYGFNGRAADAKRPPAGRGCICQTCEGENMTVCMVLYAHSACTLSHS